MGTDLRERQLALTNLATETAGLLEQLQGIRLVFAESCTAGMVAATLGGVPGISRFLCGSAVTYREATKTEWLGMERELIDRHSAVSAEVTEEMASRVMLKTPEANLSLAITGHLGPGVDEAEDGRVYVRVFQRNPNGLELIHSRQLRLDQGDRIGRQMEATMLALQSLNESLRQMVRA